MNHPRLSMALATGTGVQPTMTQDPLWVENAIARYLERLLPALSTRDDWERAIRVVDGTAELIYYLGARLQVDEARLLLRTVTRFLRLVRARYYHGPDGTGLLRSCCEPREGQADAQFADTDVEASERPASDSVADERLDG